MKGNPILIASALVYAVAGLILLFAPDELLSVIGRAGVDPLVCQLLGGAFLALASLNWYSRFSVVGGIFGRPLVGMNFLHAALGLFIIMARLRHVRSWPLEVAFGGYLILAGAFYYLLRSSPPMKLNAGQ